jgi:hypothetical protein
MATAAEAVGDSLAALNLFGSAGDLHVGNWRATTMLLKQSGGRERACAGDSSGRQSGEPWAGPFQKPMLAQASNAAATIKMIRLRIFSMLPPHRMGLLSRNAVCRAETTKPFQCAPFWLQPQPRRSGRDLGARLAPA